MTVQLLEWVIDALGLASAWLLASQRRTGWAVSLAAQLVWLVVAVLTGQWAFVVASIVYGTVAVRGWRRWRPTVTGEAVSSP